MKTLHFTFLSIEEIPVLHQTFLKAFEDYLVPIQLNDEQFDAKLKREGIELSYCVAAYDGHQMVGFILTGLGEWKGKPTAYNGGTGVIPAYRGQKLTQQLYTFLIQKLKESGIECCLLEVIDQNIPALKCYQNIGMKITRVLNCYRAKKQDLLLNVVTPTNIQIKRTYHPDWQAYKLFWDIEPSWQNSIQSVKRSINDSIILEAYNVKGTLTGYLILYPKSGAIAQFAVCKNFRKQGIGVSLLREAVNLTQAPALMCTNVDAEGKDVNNYLVRCNFNLFLKQNEMLMQLTL